MLLTVIPPSFSDTQINPAKASSLNYRAILLDDTFCESDLDAVGDSISKGSNLSSSNVASGGSDDVASTQFDHAKSATKAKLVYTLYFQESGLSHIALCILDEGRKCCIPNIVFVNA